MSFVVAVVTIDRHHAIWVRLFFRVVACILHLYYLSVNYRRYLTEKVDPKTKKILEVKIACYWICVWKGTICWFIRRHIDTPFLQLLAWSQISVLFGLLSYDKTAQTDHASGYTTSASPPSPLKATDLWLLHYLKMAPSGDPQSEVLLLSLWEIQWNVYAVEKSY